MRFFVTFALVLAGLTLTGWGTMCRLDDAGALPRGLFRALGLDLERPKTTARLAGVLPTIGILLLGAAGVLLVLAQEWGTLVILACVCLMYYAVTRLYKSWHM